MKLKKLIASILLCASLASVSVPSAMAAGLTMDLTKGEDTELYDDAPMTLWYDEEAPYGQENTSFGDGGKPNDPNDGWERWSLPLGNGYFGANVFGRTATERIQLTEKTLCNDYGSSTYNPGGLNNFSETYIDFGHAFDSVSEYSRSLDLKTAISSVSYVYDGVTYNREYFTSYEDYCMVIKLTADEEGKLSFTLRPTIPYLQDFAYDNNDTSRSKLMEVTKHGRVTSSVTADGAVINMSGHMGQYNVDFEAQYQVFTDGNVSAGTWTNVYSTNVVAGINDPYNSGVRDAAKQTLTVTNGTLEIDGATEAYIVITLGTNYDQSAGEGNSSIYTTGSNANKLNVAGVDAKAANDARMASALANSFLKHSDITEGYEALRARHVADYSELYGRVNFTLDFDKADLDRTTDELLTRYKNDEGDGAYLVMLYYQYGRYLLIASSRETTLPANLQGTWNRYNYSPWGVGYWHNINEQMNYWHAFSTDLSECFGGYVNFIDAYIAQARKNAATELSRAPFNYKGSDTGFTIGIGITPYKVGSSASCGELGFTTQMFWEYYQFTNDETILRETVYPILYEAAQFITKTVAYNESEDAYLSIYSYSPEQFNNSTSWYYTEGTPYAQSFAYLNNLHLLEAAEILGVADDALLSEVRRQIDKYDAILVGYSGQVKEFREEEYYGEIGEYTHRHISQLVGLFPGEMINSNTPAWLDAAIVTLTERGDQATGWGVAHRLNLWAHTKLGDRTYELVDQLLKSNTATNLWDLHHPFQIDGNFGATSGITEMLLQSHEGYIDPLAAIPSIWADGSFSGLVARGNFSVDASWRDGSVTELAVTSRSGGEVKIHVQNIKDATIRDSKGKKVQFTIDGADYATFNTEAGETYTVTNIPKKVTVAPAESLAAVQTSKNTFTLAWGASSDAKSYNVYKAVGDASDYTFIGNTTALVFNHTVDEADVNVRTTYRVCAVNADGRESTGILAYANPSSAEVSETQAIRLKNGSLQVVVGSEKGADSYTLYKYDKAAGKWTELISSKYPVLIYSGYSASTTYGVSATSGFFTSEIVTITEIGEAGGTSGELVEADDYNIFKDATDITLEGIGNYPNYPVTNVIDGDATGTRFAPVDKQSTPFTITVTLPSAYNVKTVRIYDFRNDNETSGRSDNTYIKVYADGVWTTLYAGVSLNRVSGKKYCEFDLGFAKAEKISFTFENTKAASSASLWEITATAAKLTSPDRTELLELVKEAENLDTSLFDVVYMTRYTSTISNAKAILGSISAGQGLVNTQCDRLRALIDGAPTKGDLDLNINVSVNDGSAAMPWDVANKIPTVAGNGGKVESDLVYKWSPESQATFNVMKDKQYYAKDYTLEFSLMLEKNAILRVNTKTIVSYEGGVLGADGWNAGPQILFDGTSISMVNGVVVAIDNVSLESASAVICDMESERWYKVAIIVPVTLGEKTEYIDICINGTKYTVKASSPFYGLSYPQFEKRNVTGEAIYLDNVLQRLDNEAVYYPVRDALNELNSASGDITVKDNVITTPYDTRVNALCAALGSDIRIYSDSTLTRQLGEYEALKNGAVVVAYSKGISAYERTYNYYTVNVKPCVHVYSDVGCLEDQICWECGEVLVPAKGHTEVVDEGVAPTCTESGISEGKHCTVCGEVTVAQETVPALGHNEVFDDIIKHPTCTESGLSNGKHCSVCNMVTADPEVIPAKGHTEVIDEGIAPTCTESGISDGKHCTVCGEVTVEQEVVPTLGHNHSAVVTPATCTEGGYTTYTCDCGDTYVADETEALGHSYNPTVTAPTCTEAGYTTYNCSACGDTYVSDETEALGHSYNAVVTEPTCTKDGYTTYTCACGDSYVADKTAAHGHDFTDATTESPKTCKVCGKTEGEKLPEPTPDPEDTPDIDPTPEKDHSECKGGIFANIINSIVNFFRKLFGLPKKCVCGDEI